MIFSCSSQGSWEAGELSTYLSSEAAVSKVLICPQVFIVLHTKLPDLECVLKTPGLCVTLDGSRLALQTGVIWAPVLRLIDMALYRSWPLAICSCTMNHWS